MMMVEKLMDQKRKYWSRAMKKGRCNLDEDKRSETNREDNAPKILMDWVRRRKSPGKKKIYSLMNVKTRISPQNNKNS